MSNRLKRIGRIIALFCICVCLIIVSLCLCVAINELFAQQQGIIQTDYKDIGTRQKIDRDVWQELKNINRQIQADTTVLTASQTADTIYLDRKYGDTDYMIFVGMRSKSGTYSDYVVIPLSDSTFEITKNVTDVSTVQWMTIKK